MLSGVSVTPSTPTSHSSTAKTAINSTPSKANWPRVDDCGLRVVDCGFTILLIAYPVKTWWPLAELSVLSVRLIRNPQLFHAALLWVRTWAATRDSMEAAFALYVSHSWALV